VAKIKIYLVIYFWLIIAPIRVHIVVHIIRHPLKHHSYHGTLSQTLFKIICVVIHIVGHLWNLYLTHFAFIRAKITLFTTFMGKVFFLITMNRAWLSLCTHITKIPKTHDCVSSIHECVNLNYHTQLCVLYHIDMCIFPNSKCSFSPHIWRLF